MKRSIAVVLFTMLAMAVALPQETDDAHEDKEQAAAEALYKKLTATKDTAWLQQVLDGHAKGLPAGGRINLGAVRSAAYVRLGAIGSKESIDVIRRIEEQMRQVQPNAPEVQGTYLPSAARHEGGMSLQPLAQTTGPDGTTYGLIAGGEMGDVDLFLITSRRAGIWSRPLLIPNRIYRGISDVSLELRGNDELIFRYTQHEPGQRNIMEGRLTPPTRAPQTGPQEWHLSLRELAKDSDGDGLTDIEEQRLRLDPNKADTDGDGIPDGKDICPNLALKDAASGEDAVLVQKAFLAIYALLGSRQLILVSPEVKPRVHFYGYAGPILYGYGAKEWEKDHPEGAVFLSWEVKQRSSASATVSIEDWEGPLAAWGCDVKLKKVEGEWVVVGTEKEWIS